MQGWNLRSSLQLHVFLLSSHKPEVIVVTSLSLNDAIEGLLVLCPGHHTQKPP